jgi:hypothetical protein
LTRGAALAASALREAGSESNLEQYGIYYDDVARIEGRWKFTRRLFVPVYVEMGAVIGDVLTRRSVLLQPD